LGLRAHGAEVEVLTIDPRSFLAPSAGLRLRDPSINRVVPDDLVQLMVWSLESNRVVRLLKRMIGTTPLGMRFFEPRKREWTYPALRHLSRLDLQRYDAVITCSQPHANHLLGLHLKKSTGLPWVAYFGDPWSRNPYAHFANPRIADYHRRLEAEVLETADRVLFTSEEMLRLAEENHAETLRGKAGVLPHSFVPEWYGPAHDRSRDSGLIRVLHTGHFYGPRSPAPLLRALSRLQRRRDLTGRLQIDSYGSFPPDDRETLVKERLDQVFRIHSVIPYLDSLALMRRHDVLLLVDAKLTQTAESVFLPSKLVDYLGSETPVMAVTPVPGSTARVVAETGGVVCDIENEEAIEEALIRLLETGSLPSPDPIAVRSYHYKEVSRQLLSTMAELAG
jgi:glycosyltransferase involved in cell wall biosynthesis